MNFSQKLVFAYTCIVVIPLSIIVIVAMGFVRKSRTDELFASSEGLVQENYQTVMQNMETFNRLELLINTNDQLTLLLTVPEFNTVTEIIDLMLSESKMLERTLGSMPNIYGLRVFTDNSLVPERWPVFMSSTRTDLESLNRWEYAYIADYLGSQDTLKYESVCSTRRLVKNRREIGWIQIAMRTEDFFPFLFKNINAYNNDYVFREVLNPETNQMELIQVTDAKADSAQKPLSPKEVDAFYKTIYRREKGALQSSGKVMLRDGRDTRYSTWMRVPDMNLVLLHTCSSGSISTELFYIQMGIIAGLLCTVILLHHLVRLLTSRLMARVYDLIGGMKMVQAGHLDAQIKVTGTDEVTEAQMTFNKMTEQLRTQVEQIKNEQELIADTEMKAMQNQINAHFLYNALETIKMQAVIAGEEDVEESISVLGKLMHYCLRWRVHEVTLEQEVDYIRSYIYLLNIRNDYVISLETEIQDEYKNTVIAKMSLQPLVENAFFYAVEPLGKDAVIKVYTEDAGENDRIWLCVQDFGPGIQEDKLRQLQDYLADDSYERDSSGSIGLKNIQQRLTAFYGKDFRLVIVSEPGHGTLVKIPVPRSKSEEE